MKLIDRMFHLRAAYREVFQQKDGSMSRAQELVLTDLCRLARIHDSAFTRDLGGRVDSHAMVYREGRREPILRILNYLHLSDADLIQAQERIKAEERNDG